MRYSTSVPGPIGRFAHHGGLRSAIATALAAATLGACTTWRPLPGSPRAVVPQRASQLRVHVASGNVLQIHNAIVVGDSLTGTREWMPGSDRVAVALADVTSVEVHRVSLGRTVLAVAILGVVVVGLAANPIRFPGLSGL